MRIKALNFYAMNMNEKEIERMGKRFFAEFKVDANGTHDYELSDADLARMHNGLLLSVWGHMEKELKEAYYQGYMAGTMEAL